MHSTYAFPGEVNVKASETGTFHVLGVAWYAYDVFPAVSPGLACQAVHSMVPPAPKYTSPVSTNCPAGSVTALATPIARMK